MSNIVTFAGGRVGHVDYVDNPPGRGHSIWRNVGAWTCGQCGQYVFKLST